MADGFTQGPAVSPASDLLAWFEGEGQDKKVRIPLVVVPDPLGLSKGYIAASAATPEADGLLIRLDDTGMSVGLADRIRNDCPFDVPCAIWVEGTWGALISGGPMGGPGLGGPGLGGPGGPDLSGFDTGPKKHPFAVRDYVGKVQGEAAHILVEG